MGFKVGANVVLDGEKQFREALNGMNSNLKVLQSEMKLATSAFSSNANSLKAYTARQEVLTKQIDQQKNKVKLLEHALEQQQKKYADGAKSVDALKAALEAAKEKYGENSDEVKKLADSLEKAEKAQDKFRNDANKLEADLNNAKAGLNKMNDELKKVEQHTTGVGKLKTAFNDVKDKIEEAQKKTEKLREAMSKVGDFAKAGLAAGATAVAAIGTAAVKAGKELYAMATEVAATGDEIQKTSQKVGLSYESYQKWNYAMQVSGTEMTSCVNGLKTLTNTFDDAMNGSAGAEEKFSRLGISLTDLQGKSREEVFGTVVRSLQNVQDETQKAAIANDLFGKSGQNLLPMFNMTNAELDALMQQAEDYGMVMSDAAVDASAAFQDSMTKLKGTAGGLKNMFIGELLPSITGISDGLTEILHGEADKGSQLISDAVGQFVDRITAMLPQAMELGGAILTAVVNSISANLPTLVQAGVPIIMELAGAITKNLPLIVTAAIDCIKALAQGLMDNTDEIISATVEVIEVLCTGLTDMLPLLMETGIELLLGLISGLSDSGTLSTILKAGITCAGELVKGLIRCVPNLLDAGWQLIKGLWQGISDAAGWLWEQIKGIGTTLVNTVKGIFKIGSPSRVFRDEIGGQLMKGLAIGITDNAEQARKAMREATASLSGSAEMDYQIHTVTDRISAANRISAYDDGRTYTETGAGGRTDMTAVIELLRQIAEKDGKVAVFTPDGQFAGWIDGALGERAGMARRYV